MKYYFLIFIFICLSCKATSTPKVVEEETEDSVLWKEVFIFQQEASPSMLLRPWPPFSAELAPIRIYPIVIENPNTFRQPHMPYWEDSTARQRAVQQEQLFD